MIDGIGIDVVDIDRFKASLERTPGLAQKLFTEAEQIKPVASLAARFAAKEALAKALNAGKGLSWQEAEVVNLESGKPVFLFRGEIADLVDGADVHLSLSHDAGIASAMVIVGAQLMRAEARVDLDRIAANITLLKGPARTPLMAVGKADAYGHGLVEVGLAAERAGADWLGVALLEEAIKLRTHGVRAPILAWLVPPGSDFKQAVAHDIDIAVASDCCFYRNFCTAQQTPYSY